MKKFPTVIFPQFISLFINYKHIINYCPCGRVRRKVFIAHIPPVIICNNIFLWQYCLT